MISLSPKTNEYPDRKSYSPKIAKRDYAYKMLELNFGLFICAIGLFLTVQANVGLAPWMALNVGLQNITGIDYGIWNDIIGIIIIVADIILAEKIGFGTLGDCLLIGTYVTIFDRLGLFPVIHSLTLGLAVMIAGIIITAVACFYIFDSAFGIGPRDSLMIALARKFPNRSIGQIRIFMESAVLIAGWCMGAKVSIGTVIYVLCMGPALDAVFYLFKFDARRTVNESVIETGRNLRHVRERI